MKDIALKAEESEVLRYLGYRGNVMDESMKMKLDHSIARMTEAAEPRYIHGYYELSGDPLVLGETEVTLPGEDIKKHLSGCFGCYLFAATLGPRVEREIARSQKTDLAGSVIMDAACDDLIEKLCDHVQSVIEGQCRAQGHYITDRYSPGYGDLPIELQPRISALLDTGRRIGLTVSSYNILTPRKSVTALIGVKDQPSKASKRGCQSCSLYASCAIRKEGGSCGR